VSQQLSRLEADVGVPLVDRAGGRAEMTAAGRVLAGVGSRIGAALGDAALELAAMVGEARGAVSIGAMVSAIPDIAATALPWLAQRYPGIEPRLVEAYAADGLPALRMGELDVLLVSDDRDAAIPVPVGVQSFVMFESRYRIVVPESGSWRTVEGPGDLDGRPWVGAPAGTARAHAFARFSAAHGVSPSVEHVAGSQMAARAMVSGQLGAALLPEFVAVAIPRARVCDFEVPGSFLVRLFRRRLSDRSIAAVDAAAMAVYEAMTAAAIRYGDEPYAPRPVIVNSPRDPSEGESGGS
jgi:DNA-binding transcriptional LysR family regulator